MSNNNGQNGNIGAALVVGSGIGGMQAALDLAESGIKVYLVDNKPSIGGVMSQLDKTFPTNDCAMCTMAPRLVEISRHKDIEKLTLSQVESITGEPGNFSVTLNKKPRYIDEEKCTGCAACVENCPVRNVVQIQEQEPVDIELRDKAKVREILDKYRHVEGPLMPVLQEINAIYNYFPENVLKYVAQETGYPLTHIYKIATFYSSFSIAPRGEHVINICMGTACYVKGSGRIMETFGEVLGIQPEETTPDLKFTLHGVRCIGCCGLAPVVMIGDVVFGKLTIQEIPEIINKYRER